MIQVDVALGHAVDGDALGDQAGVVRAGQQLQQLAGEADAMIGAHGAGLPDGEVVEQIQVRGQWHPSAARVGGRFGETGVVALDEAGRKVLAAASVVMLASRNSLVRRSCRLPHKRSIRPLACGE